MRLAFGMSPRPLRILLAAVLLVACAKRVDAAPSLEVLKYDLAANQDVPELCFHLSETVARRLDAPLESLVGVEPAVPLSATPRNERLCLTGFNFGAAYTITLRAGLPGVSGVLAKDTQFRVEIPNRPPELSFAAPESDLLPRLGIDGLPLRSVNVPKIDVAIFRIADDDLLIDRARAPLTGLAVAAFAPSRGEHVWNGSLAPKGDANRDTVTSLPVASSIGPLKPGLYVAVAWPSGTPIERSTDILPTQYFTVSDLGLIAYRNATSLIVVARSLANAAGAEGIDVALVARNNRELARVRADGNGFARFEAPLLRGAGGDRPAAIRAYGAAGDFTSLTLDDPTAPGGGGDSAAGASATKAVFHSTRASYRPGETVSVLVLLRNGPSAAAQKPLLTVRIRRPDGTVFDTRSLQDQGGGSFDLTFTVPTRGAAGLWRLEAEGDAGGPAMGVGAVMVDDSPRSNLTVSVGAESAVMDPSQPASIAIQAQYSDGRGAAGSPGELGVSISAANTPFPAFPGYSFGLADEASALRRFEPAKFTTDANGKATVPLKLDGLPKATRPLDVRLSVRILDAGGNVSERVVDVPVANQPLLLGVKAAPGPAFAEGQPTRFEIIAVGPDGARQEKAAAGWEILRQDPAPSWHYDGTRFAYRSVFKDTHIAGGVIDIPMDAPATITPSLPAGRYRIEIFDQGGESISSARFSVGWAAPDSAASPDRVEVKPVKPFFTPGDGAEIFVKPPYEADVLLIPADEMSRDSVVQHIPAAGAPMHLDMPRDSADVVQLLAIAVAPPNPATPGLARRAFGGSALIADPAARGLDVKVTPPAKIAPQQTLSIPVAVSGAGSEPVYVRITAQDESASDGDGAEKLAQAAASTESATAPLIRDVYDRIITTSGVTIGPPAQTPIPAVSAVSAPPQGQRATFASAVIALDKSGAGVVPLTTGDFSGRLRVKAIAWSASRSGQVESDLTIQYPLSVDLNPPAQLMPDDHADLNLKIDNVDGPRGEYRVKVNAEGAVSVPDDTGAVANLAEHEQRAQQFTLQAHGPGEGMVTVSVQGPEGIAFERHFGLTVRPGSPMNSRHAILSLKPGATFALDPGFGGGARSEPPAISLLASDHGMFDLRGMARDLALYARTSTEQAIARATPCFAPKEVLPALGINGLDANSSGACLDRAVRLILTRQEGDGGFGLWEAQGSDYWLTAYAADFLTRAKAAGAAIPEAAFQLALDNLAARRPASLEAAADPSEIAAAAYANKVLAANGRLTIFQLRRFADLLQGSARTPLSTGLTGAAFAIMGDKNTAAGLFAQALAMPAGDPDSVGFGSELRDNAMLTAIMAESDAMAPPTLQTAADKTLALAAARRQFNVEEAVWLFRAGAALPATTGDFKLKVGDLTIKQNEPMHLTAGPGDAAGLPSVKNLSDSPVQIFATAVGVSPTPDAKDQGGLEIQRWLFDISGKPIDPMTLRQNDPIVVVLTGRAAGNATHPLVQDSLPGGWSLEAADIIDPANRYPWLKDLTGATHVAFENGRYIATPNLTGERREFKLAYVARAAVRGQFTLPGPTIDDMVLPAMAARGVTGRTKIDAAP